MSSTPVLPKRTKIVCTIGPASSSQAVLTEMIRAGMNMARINFSHGTAESNLELLEKVRKASKEAGIPVALLQDLQGPKIRVGVIPGEGMELIEGKIVTLQAGVVQADPGIIPVPYERMAHDVRRGDRILIADGTRELEVLEKRGKMIKARVVLGGRLLSHKGINVPTVSLSVESLTEKDEQDLAFGLKQGFDFVALSFVRRREDVTILREKIKRYLPAGMPAPGIIVKIEKHEALDNFDEILEETDAVMIARGDLGVETPITKVPIHQKELIAKCIVAGKPVITATEMLASMEGNPRPTRAEVSDVANAVIDHTDAVMLSGESAMGKYPVQTVKTMAEIIRRTEESPLDALMPAKDATGTPVPVSVSAAAVEVARHIEAAAILVLTRSGFSARAAASFRPEIPLYVATPNKIVHNQLLLSWGITPFIIDSYDDSFTAGELALTEMKKREGLKKGNHVVVVSGLKRKKGGYDSSLRVVEI